MKIKSDKFYIIRHLPTGLLKAGGHNANFNKTGKLWRGSRVKNHLRMFHDGPKKWGETLIERINRIWGQSKMSVEDCVIVEVELTPTQAQPLKDFIEKEMK